MQVFVTARAEKHFDSIVSYIRSKWGKQTAEKFIIKTDELLKLLKNYPTIGQIENGEIRGFQLSKHTRLMYRIRDEKVIILSFFDVRQNPTKKFS